MDQRKPGQRGPRGALHSGLSALTVKNVLLGMFALAQFVQIQLLRVRLPSRSTHSEKWAQPYLESDPQRYVCRCCVTGFQEVEHTQLLCGIEYWERSGRKRAATSY